jgi:hypothetical protein
MGLGSLQASRNRDPPEIHGVHFLEDVEERFHDGVAPAFCTPLGKLTE